MSRALNCLEVPLKPLIPLFKTGALTQVAAFSENVRNSLKAFPGDTFRVLRLKNRRRIVGDCKRGGRVPCPRSMNVLVVRTAVKVP